MLTSKQAKWVLTGAVLGSVTGLFVVFVTFMRALGPFYPEGYHSRPGSEPLWRGGLSHWAGCEVRRR